MNPEKQPPAEEPEVPPVDDAAAKVKAKMGEIKRTGTVASAIPDHIGVSDRVAARLVPQTPEARSDLPSCVVCLGPVEGSALHVAQLEVQLTLKDINIATLREDLAKSQREHAELFKSAVLKRLGEQQKSLQLLLAVHRIPGASNIHRNDDGTYTILPAQAPPPAPLGGQ